MNVVIDNNVVERFHVNNADTNIRKSIMPVVQNCEDYKHEGAVEAVSVGGGAPVEENDTFASLGLDEGAVIQVRTRPTDVIDVQFKARGLRPEPTVMSSSVSLEDNVYEKILERVCEVMHSNQSSVQINRIDVFNTKQTRIKYLVKMNDTFEQLLNGARLKTAFDNNERKFENAMRILVQLKPRAD